LGYAGAKENIMRYPVYGVLAVLVLAAPASAQSSSAAPDKSAGVNAPQSQPARDSKPGQTKPDPTPQTAKDDSMSNYDVNGSNASDAMGRTP
jgi:hypothetical protein